MIKVFVDGREGTTGLKIDEKLSKREDVEILRIDEDKRKDVSERKKFINAADVVFLCLPDDAARESALLCENDKTVIIDASTAHRTESGWTYGFPELDAFQREKIRTSKRIAVPGCHATGFISLVNPLVKGGIMSKDYPVVCHSLTGYSGGGKKMIAEYRSQPRSALLDAPRQYALSQTHKHQKEMQYITGISRTPLFNPIVSDFYSGMEVSIPLYSDMLKDSPSAERVHAYMESYYSASKMVKVMPFGGDVALLSSNMLEGRDDMRIYVFGNDERVLLAACYDNLGKGASGQAVQCFNIVTGRSEDYTLVTD